MSKMYFLPLRPAFDSAGITVPGSQHWFTLAGTNTPSAPFTDATLTTPLENPIIANGIGYLPPVYLDETVSYRVRVYLPHAEVGVDTPTEEYDPYTPAAAVLTYLGDSGFDGLFANASLLIVPEDVDVVSTTGYATLGLGGANYIYDASVDAAYVTANPRSSFMSANARGFRLDLEQDLTPQMLGDPIDGTNGAAAAIAAIGALPASGGSLQVTAQSVLASSVVLDSKHNVTLEGTSGSGAGYGQPPTSQWTYSGTGSGRFISAQNTNAVTLADMGIRYSSGSYTGDLVAMTNTNAGADNAYSLVKHCLLGGINVATARSLISLEGAILFGIKDSHLQWGTVGVRGRKEVAVGNVTYSNVGYIQGNTFDNLTTAAIFNAGDSWLVLGNAFEGTNGGGGGMPRAYFDNISGASAGITGGLVYLGNWHGDAVNVTDAWFCNGSTQLRGHLNAGNLYDTASTTVPGMKLTGTITGAAILANTFSSTIDFGNTPHYGVLCSGNFLYNDIANLHIDSDDIFIVANKRDGLYAKNYLRLNTVQEWSVGINNRPIGGPGIWSFNAPASTGGLLTVGADSGQALGLMGRAGGARRFLFGSLDGTTVDLGVYNDADAFVGSAFSITRSTMDATFGGNINVASGKVYKVNGTQVVGAQGSAVARITRTATSGSLPVADGSITIANAATPTVVELLEYCTELEAKLEALTAKFRAATGHGLIA